MRDTGGGGWLGQNAGRRQCFDTALDSDIIWILRLECDLQEDLREVHSGISGKKRKWINILFHDTTVIKTGKTGKQCQVPTRLVHEKTLGKTQKPFIRNGHILNWSLEVNEVQWTRIWLIPFQRQPANRRRTRELGWVASFQGIYRKEASPRYHNHSRQSSPLGLRNRSLTWGVLMMAQHRHQSSGKHKYW